MALRRIPRVEILSQGDEVVTGEIADTNAAWLSQALMAAGFDVSRHIAVGDRLESLIEALREIGARADLCLCTGGLGPTSDDLTAEAVAAAFDAPLQLDEQALEQIRARYGARQQVMPEVNQKQAMLPRGADRIDNLWGTAPGFWFQHGCCRFGFMPGVPNEMRQMFTHALGPVIKSGYEPVPSDKFVFRTFGLGESQLQERINELALPRGVKLGFRVDAPYVDVKLTFEPGLVDAGAIDWMEALRSALGAGLLSTTRNGGSDVPAGLVEVVGKFMADGNHTLSVIEAGSGELTRQLAREPWFIESQVIGNVDRLAAHFGTEKPATNTRGEWEPFLTGMALAHRQRSRADHAIVQVEMSTDLTAPVALMLVDPAGAIYAERTIHGDEKRRRIMAAAWALDTLRKRLSAAQRITGFSPR